MLKKFVGRKQITQPISPLALKPPTILIPRPHFLKSPRRPFTTTHPISSSISSTPLSLPLLLPNSYNFPLSPPLARATARTPTPFAKISPLPSLLHSFQPLEIYINEGAKLTLHGLQQYYVGLNENEKNRKLIDLLDALEFNQLVIFVNSVPRASELNKLLVECNFPSLCIHSGLKQDERIEKYRKFKEFKARIMVATNLFGRGIDIERVNVVINYDMPENADTYLHRVGRAGRFGTKGLAISFVTTPTDKQVLADVQARFVVQVPELPDEIDASTYMGA
jgi:hypothetical protein